MGKDYRLTGLELQMRRLFTEWGAGPLLKAFAKEMEWQSHETCQQHNWMQLRCGAVIVRDISEDISDTN